MKSQIDYARLLPADQMAGEDDEETALLLATLGSARAYLNAFPWCHAIRKEFFGLAEWQPNSQNPSGFDQAKRVDLAGAPHFNKATGQDVPTPHVHEKGAPGGVRPAEPSELPEKAPEKAPEEVPQ